MRNQLNKRVVAAQEHDIPYGIGDLVDKPALISEAPRTVTCYVKTCQQPLRTPTRTTRGDLCPQHGIRCHYSAAGVTYCYADVRRNIIASRELFANGIVGHPFKYESHRLGLERSEDSLSWNVFRSLQEAGSLRDVAQLMTGHYFPHEPLLFLWGICASDASLDPWPLLIEARGRFESNLPVERPLTEPDIALYLPGRYLILIEAKFTSGNTFYRRGPRRDAQSLTLDELLGIYQDDQLQILDLSKAVTRDRIHYQLWRNLIFAEWMARQDHAQTEAFHVNLVRSGYERDTAQEFGELVGDNYKNRFQRLTWEQIYRQFASDGRLATLQRYLETKTAGLTEAFRI